MHVKELIFQLNLLPFSLFRLLTCCARTLCLPSDCAINFFVAPVLLSFIEFGSVLCALFWEKLFALTSLLLLYCQFIVSAALVHDCFGVGSGWEGERTIVKSGSVSVLCSVADVVFLLCRTLLLVVSSCLSALLFSFVNVIFFVARCVSGLRWLKPYAYGP